MYPGKAWTYDSPASASQVLGFQAQATMPYKDSNSSLGLHSHDLIQT
jgi:hypothetical protein